jgi:hypothetical protein
VEYEREGYDRSGADPHRERDYGGGDDFSREGDYMDTGDNNRQHGVSERVDGGGGLKKSASKANVEGISKDKAGREGSLGPLKDEFDSDSDLENEMSGKLDSGIDSFEEEALPIMEEDDFLDTLEEEVDIYIPGTTSIFNNQVDFKALYQTPHEKFKICIYFDFRMR